MSRSIALDTIRLRPVPRYAHTEYSLNYHPDYIRRKTGLEPGSLPALRRFYQLWGIDFNWSTNDGLRGNWQAYGRTTDMGHAEYAADGHDQRQGGRCPFETPEQVWEFDAVNEYGLPDFHEQIAAYEQHIRNARENFPDQLTPGGYYKTIVSGAIQAFGWDMLLLACSEPDKMEPVFDSFFRRTLFHMKCWAETSAEVIIQHDDFVWSNGAFMNPEIYRKVIIPRYAELWKPLHAAGKKVLFCSDGNFMEFAADVVAAGADGLIFEPCNDFEFMVEHFGQDTVLVGSAVDCRDMSFESWDVVQKSLDRTFELARRCNGLILAVGNHLPANIPEEMMERYIHYLKAHWNRTA